MKNRILSQKGKSKAWHLVSHSSYTVVMLELKMPMGEILGLY